MGKTGWGSVLKNWLFVYIGNFVGSVAWAYLMLIGPFTQGNFGAAEPNTFALNAVGIAVAKTLTYKSVGTVGWWSAMCNGIGCNFMVNVAILLAITSKDFIGKFFGIWLIMAFVAIGFEHSVANMYFLPSGMFVTHSFPALVTKMVDGKPWNALLANNGGLNWGTSGCAT